MRRKTSPTGTGGYNQNKRQRYQQGSQGGSQGHHHNPNRPRKNYSAMREKYLAQARDALAAGDRVLAENYFQHADHCYRMMVEEGYQPRQNYNNNQQQDAQADGEAPAPAEELMPENVSQLPAFLTANYEQPETKAAQPVPVANWEE